MTPFRASALALSMASAAFLAGCSVDDAPQPQKVDDDPALTGALADQIMVDPQLVQQDRGNDALAVEGPPKAEVPTQETGSQAAQMARAEAAKLVGGTIRTAPSPTSAGQSLKLAEAVTAPRIAGLAGGSAAACASKVEYTAAWAARLPAPLLVYPRGAVQEAAGTDRAGCSLRVVTFTVPVTPKDVIDFYYTRVSAAGFAAEYRLEDKDHVLGGRKGSVVYLVYARERDDGLTEVDLISSRG